ncbi:MAG: DUF4250 domain-containing protein [Candidatus Izemoplasmatales bacterium]
MSSLYKMDPHVVVSLVNTKLRDGVKDLDGVCEELAVERPLLDQMLARIGYVYDAGLKRYRPSDAR